MWRAVASRDKSCDGQFYYSVATTGVYCRPSCPSRQANRENVRFHTSCADAERAGFRPCKRCKPDAASHAEEHARKVANACRLIETAEQPPTLDALAATVGLSPYHFHRIFKVVTGVTPKAYALAHRQQKMRSSLQRSETVTHAIYDAGYSSAGRFYADAHEMLGMTPTAFRDGGKATALRFAVGECSLGSILVAASDRGVAAILLGDDPEQLVRELQDQFPKATLTGGDRSFEEIIARVVAYVEHPRTGLDLPLDVRGTAFQHRVWQALQKIPVGQTRSYTEVAAMIGKPEAVRAVAGACAANTVAVAIPCHRVVRRDGDVSGYRWGVARKKALLAREAKSEHR